MRLPRTTPGRYSVEAVAKALDVLEAFTGSGDLALNEVCRRVSLSKSRTFRLLHTLAERGYVERHEDGGRYRLGPKLLERASCVRRDIRQLARPFMQTLHDRFNETVNLGEMIGGEVLYLDILETSRPFRMTATVGCRMPVCRTAMGKALLACLKADEPGSPAHACLAGLHTRERQTINRQLERIRNRGYARDDEENEQGVACIGAAILDRSGNPVAALSISGPAHRIFSAEKSLAQGVMEMCRGISRSLGHTDSQPAPAGGISGSRGFHGTGQGGPRG